MSVPTLQLHVDWENDGDWTGTGEDVTARVLPDRAVTWERGNSQTAGAPQPQAGSFSATLDNRSRDYSPRNAASPLYGNLLPGRPLRWQADSGGTIALWRGAVDDLSESVAIGDRTAHLAGVGALARLQAADHLSTALFTNVSTDQVFGYLMAAAGLAASDYTVLDQGKTVFSAWWCDDDNALTMLRRILDAEGPGARAYELADGRIAFHSRHYRVISARGGTSQATFSDTATAPYYEGFSLAPRQKDVINSATIKVATIAFGSSTILFTYGEPFVIPPNSTRSITASFATPIVVGLWTAATNDTREDESIISVSATTYATRSTYTATNPNNRAITLTGLNLQGQASTVATWEVGHTISNATSVANHGLRTAAGSWDPWPYLATTAARGLCDAVVSAYQAPRAAVAIVVRNAGATNLAQQLNRDISDRITVVNAQAGLNGPVYIERIRQAVSDGRFLLTTQFACEEPGTHGDWYVVGSSLVGTGRAGY